LANPEHRRLPADLTSMALSIIRDRCSDLGTLACEKLRERSDEFMKAVLAFQETLTANSCAEVKATA
jgi:hypothetical protein